MRPCKCIDETENDLTKTKKNVKKNSRLFTIFHDFTSIFQTLSKSGKLLGWAIVMAEFKTRYKPCQLL